MNMQEQIMQYITKSILSGHYQNAQNAIADAIHYQTQMRPGVVILSALQIRDFEQAIVEGRLS